MKKRLSKRTANKKLSIEAYSASAGCNVCGCGHSQAIFGNASGMIGYSRFASWGHRPMQCQYG